jgi:hypothetical protein
MLGFDWSLRQYPLHRRILRWLFPASMMFLGIGFVLDGLALI